MSPRYLKYCQWVQEPASHIATLQISCNSINWEVQLMNGSKKHMPISVSLTSWSHCVLRLCGQICHSISIIGVMNTNLDDSSLFFEASVQCADHENMTTIFQSKSKGFLHVLVPSFPWFPTHSRASRWSHHVFFLVFPPVFANSSLAVFKVDPRKPNDASVRDLFLFPKTLGSAWSPPINQQFSEIAPASSSGNLVAGPWLALYLHKHIYSPDLSKNLQVAAISCSIHPAGLPPRVLGGYSSDAVSKWNSP